MRPSALESTSSPGGLLPLLLLLPQVAGLEQCVGMFVDRSGATVPRVWSNAPFNFDNLGQALVSLFVVVTLNGCAGPVCCCYLPSLGGDASLLLAFSSGSVAKPGESRSPPGAGTPTSWRTP